MQRDRNASARQITNQDDFRRLFWDRHPTAVRKKYRNGDYPADTRTAFVDFVDACARDGIISERLAARVTL
jgi:hypothetical protein